MRILRCLLLAAVTAVPALADTPPSAIVETRDGPGAAELAAPTRVVVLGTGTPIPDANRAGSSIAVIYRGQAYLFDVGPGSVQNATRARYLHDIPSLYPSQVCCLFLTHMHSDHTLDYDELAYTLWWRRSQRLRAFGPEGLAAMSEDLYRMMAADTRLRTTGRQPVPNPDMYRVDVTEIEAGIVFEADGMTVEAFDVPHGSIKPAFGYRITTPDRRIVISGDTAYSEKLAEMAKGADLLFHEVASDSGIAAQGPAWQAYHREVHTPASELGKLAGIAKPGKLVLYHGLFFGVPEQTLLDEVRAAWDGDVVLANDLDLY